MKIFDEFLKKNSSCKKKIFLTWMENFWQGSTAGFNIEFGF